VRVTTTISGYAPAVPSASSSFAQRPGDRREPARPPRSAFSPLRVLPLPGVFQPRSDTWMLIDAVRRQALPAGARVLDLCTGSGAVAVAAARRGASVTAVDVSRGALVSVRLNALLNGVHVRVRRGDLFDAVRGERFDLIVANPPYLPAEDDALPARGRARAWDAGRDGRAVLDPLCGAAAAHLEPGGAILIVHSSVSDLDMTMRSLQATSLSVDVVAEHDGPLGPLLRERRDLLCDAGLLDAGADSERVAIVRGVRADEATAVRAAAAR
jgi:release factor glutamine methyltransferase